MPQQALYCIENCAMSDVFVSAHNGIRTIGPEARMESGYVRKLVNWIMALDDGERVHKMPGRTQAATLPSGATASNTKGLQHVQFDQGTDQLVLNANSKYYRASAGTALGSWTAIQDAAGTPADFSRAGSFLKAIPDGRGQSILFGGVSGERPLLLQEDGVARFLSLKKPQPPSLAAITGVGSETRPNTNTGSGFTNPANAYDDNSDTFSHATLTAPGTAQDVWEFAAGATSSDHLFIKIATSSLPPEDVGGGSTDYGQDTTGTGPGAESVVASLKVETSNDNGVSYSTLYEGSLPIGGPFILQEAVSASDFEDLLVRVTLTYSSGTAQVTAYVYEIWASDTGGQTINNEITDGTYYYATTEVHKVTLASGRIILVESAPSDPTKITTGGGANYGITCTPAARANLDTDGCADTLLYRNVYRTTRGGVWPNLGFVGSTTISKAELHDNFDGDLTGATLGSPGIYTVSVGSATIHAAGQAPDFRDATLYRGAVVAIPAHDPLRIQWSLPGQPEYFPLPSHDLVPLASMRNDELKGIVTLSDTVIIILYRTAVARIRDLQFANQPAFDLGRLDRDILTSNQGLAGSPLSYAVFESQTGHNLLGWVSDNGIWMTDGSLPSERGMGVRKLSVNLHWDRDVDTSRLAETRLTFDPKAQILWFDYHDRDGNRRSFAFHTSALHWIPSGQNQMVPKVTGPHDKPILTRCIGELSGEMHQWSLSTDALKVFNERTGTDDAGSDIISFQESGWEAPQGPHGTLHIYEGSVYHSDWGASETLRLDLLSRKDQLGSVRPVSKRGLSLRGERATHLGLINSAGQSFKVRATHIGKTTSSGTPVRALGPIVLEAEGAPEVES